MFSKNFEFDVMKIIRVKNNINMNAEYPEECIKNQITEKPAKLSHCQRLFRDFVEGKWSWSTETLPYPGNKPTSSTETAVSSSVLNSEKEVKKRTLSVARSHVRKSSSSRGNATVEKRQLLKGQTHTQAAKRSSKENTKKLAKERKNKHRKTPKQLTNERKVAQVPKATLENGINNTQILEGGQETTSESPIEEPLISNPKQVTSTKPDYVLSFGEPSSIVEHEFTMSSHSASSFFYKDMVLRIYVPCLSEADHKMELKVSAKAVRFSSLLYDLKLNLPHVVVVEESTARFCANCGGPHITVYLPLAAEVYYCSVNYNG